MHYQWLSPPDRHINSRSIMDYKSGAIGGIFIAHYLRLPLADILTDRHFFIFDNYKYRLETPIILPTRSTLRPDPSLWLRQSFARLLRSFSLHPVSVFVRVRPAFRSRAVGGVSSRGAAPNPAKTLCFHFRIMNINDWYITSLIVLDVV